MCECTFSETVNNKINRFYETNQIPNILFYGETSKSRSLLDKFLSKLYNDLIDVHHSEYILTVDCIYGKGIQFIRDEIKFFAKTNVNLRDKKGKDLFKSVILLNAEKLTIDAQSALRRCIELFNGTTRFFMIVYEKTNVLAPILSRFSEIYIPSCNHKTHIFHNVKQMDANKRNRGIVSRMIQNKIEKNDNHNKVNIVRESEILYRKGVSALDIILYIESLEDSKEKYEVLVYIDDVRYYIRNEVLLLTTLLYKLKNAFYSLKTINTIKINQ